MTRIVQGSPESHFSPQHFSTRNLPERERVAYWRDCFARVVVNCDVDDTFVFIVRLGGISTLSQRGREVSLQVGDAAGFLSADPASAAVSEIEALSLSIRREALAPLVDNIESKALKRIPHQCE